MARNTLIALVAFGAVVIYVAASGAGPGADTDGDDVIDPIDNCTQLSNPSQIDTDRDGFGNNCDADFTNDGTVGIPDFIVYLPAFPSSIASPNYVPEVDMTADGAIGISDFVSWLPFFPSVQSAADGRSAPTVPTPQTCTGAGPC